MKRDKARLSSEPQAQPAASAAPTRSPLVVAAGNTLTLHLAGRICLVQHDGHRVAVFLDAQKNAALGFPKHYPVLRAAIDDCTQKGADLATISLADQKGRVHALWDLTGCDMKFEGIEMSQTTVAQADAIANLRDAFKRVNPKARWRTAELFEDDPRKYGIVARLSLDGFARIDSMFFDGDGTFKGAEETAVASQDRTFLPGGHRQQTHA